MPQAKEQNVFNVKVNFLDQLLVEEGALDLDQLKDKAKNFLIATGDGVMSHSVGAKTIGRNREVEMITGANGKTNAAFPEREWVRKADITAHCRVRAICGRRGHRQKERRVWQSA